MHGVGAGVNATLFLGSRFQAPRSLSEDTRPRPTERSRMSAANIHIGNTSVQVFGSIEAGGIKELGKWGDLATLQGKRASAFSGSLLDLGALGEKAE